MKCGKIELYGQDGRMVDTFKYAGIKERKSIIEIWRKRYPAAFDKCYFIIIPHTDIYKVKTNGENHKHGNQFTRHSFKTNPSP